MHLSISIVASDVPIQNDFLSLEVGSDMTIADLKAIIESDTNIPSPALHLSHNEHLLADDAQTIVQAGITDGDMLGLMVRSNSQSTPQTQAQRANKRVLPNQGPRSGSGSASRQQGGAGAGPDPEMIRLQMLGDPAVMAAVRERNPALADAASDAQRFREAFGNEQRKALEIEAEKQARLARLNADPFDVEAQREIEEMIRQEAVMENLQNAMEHTPEAFGRVSMLYIPLEINGHPVKAFVDSGAQATIISPSCAEACNIMRLVDRRFSGIAKGVGSAPIIGRVHSTQVRIGNLFLPCSLTVLEGKDVDMLLGLDMLKRHQAVIDLEKGVLRIKDTVVPFLGEADLPKSFEEALADEPKVPGPAGTEIGAVSGAVTQHETAAPTASASSSSAPSAAAAARAFGGAANTSLASTSGGSSSLGAVESRWPAASINQIVELGFSKTEAIQALEVSGGNVEAAIGFLL